jgi:hypothetical protein
LLKFGRNSNHKKRKKGNSRTPPLKRMFERTPIKSPKNRVGEGAFLSKKGI